MLHIKNYVNKNYLRLVKSHILEQNVFIEENVVKENPIIKLTKSGNINKQEKMMKQKNTTKIYYLFEIFTTKTSNTKTIKIFYLN